MKPNKYFLMIIFLIFLYLPACSNLPDGEINPLEPDLSSQTPASRAIPTPMLTSSPSANSFQGTISIWHSWDEAELPTLLAIMDRFQEVYPGLLFDVLYVPFENLRASYEIASSQGGGPSLLFAPAEWGVDLYEMGLIADLTDRATEALLSGMFEPALGSGQYHGTLISLPYSQRGVVLYRNRAIIPERPATYADLIRLSQTSTKDDSIGAILEQAPGYSGGHLYGLGGSFLDEDGNPQFNSPAGLAWIELLRSFQQAGPTEYLTDNDLELFRQGRAGFLIDGTWNRSELAMALGNDLVIDPWPTLDQGALAGFVWTENVFLNSSAQELHAEHAWLFVEYMLSNPSQILLAQTQNLPVVQVSLESILDEQALTALAGGVAYPIYPQFPILLSQINQTLWDALYGARSAEEVLQVAEDAYNTARENSFPSP